ncbi:MAG: ATP-binding cassette domain-containing protein [Candidatus Cloacimonetes bacterium]|nr:ATP-binding cassette domain-containing protein [Candidatus Cloacimonadota bacterium]
MISLQNVSVQYGERVLFGGVSLQPEIGARYGIVGANGAGKSTLLRVVAGTEQPSSGFVERPSSIKIGLLDQDHYRYEEVMILDVVLGGRVELASLLSEKDRILSLPELSDDQGMRLGEIEERIGALGGYTAESEAAIILEGLGIPVQRHREPLRVLSGGYRLRALLARLLFSQPDLMLLDEPTNHLDIYSIQWLEGYLIQQKQTLMLVSHDIQFLNKVSTHTLDVDHETVKVYRGNYTHAMRQKAEQALILDSTFKQQEKRKADLQEFIDRFKAKASKATQAKSKQKMLDRLDAEGSAQSSRRAPSFTFNIHRPSGQIALKAKDINKSFNGVQVLHNVGFEIGRGEKVAFLGPNGIGKSTLLKILSGRLTADSGKFEWGHEAHFSYVPQDHKEELEAQTSLNDWLHDCRPTATISQVRGILGCMLFSGDDALKKIKSLSGGEASRLLMARSMITDHNVLILDEPTNHLDMEAIDALIEALKDYAGTLLFVSHNRHFVSALATRIIEMTASGIGDFIGTYDEWLAKAHADWLSAPATGGKGRSSAPAASESARRQTVMAEPAVMDHKQRKELRNRLSSLGKLVEELESKQEDLESGISEIEATISDYQKFGKLSPQEQKKLVKQKEELTRQVQKVIQEWEAKSLEVEELSQIV